MCWFYCQVLQYTVYCGLLFCIGSESTWWVRNLVKEYFPPLSWQEPTLLEFLKHHGYLNSANYNPPENVCSRFLAWIRSCAEGVAHHVLVWILIIMAASCSLVAFCFKV